MYTVKPVLSSHSERRPKIGFQDQLSLNAGKKYFRILHSAILFTFIELPFVIKIFVLSILSMKQVFFATFTGKVVRRCGVTFMLT